MKIQNSFQQCNIIYINQNVSAQANDQKNMCTNWKVLTTAHTQLIKIVLIKTWSDTDTHTSNSIILRNMHVLEESTPTTNKFKYDFTFHSS